MSKSVITENDLKLKAMFIERASEMWDLHYPTFKRDVLEKSDGNKGSMTFTAAIDASEPREKLKTSIAFSKPYKDERIDQMDDPNQPELPGYDGEVTGEGTGEEPPHAEAGDGTGEEPPTGTEPKKRGRPKKTR